MTFVTCKSKARDNSSMSLGETSWKYSTIRVSHYKWSEMKEDWDKLKMYAISPQESWQSLSCVWFFATPWTKHARLLCLWDFPGKKTGVDSHSLLQGIFPTQESNPGLLHCRQIISWATREDHIKMKYWFTKFRVNLRFLASPCGVLLLPLWVPTTLSRRTIIKPILYLLSMKMRLKKGNWLKTTQ